jgi:hypothetical protein
VKKESRRNKNPNTPITQLSAFLTAYGLYIQHEIIKGTSSMKQITNITIADILGLSSFNPTIVLKLTYKFLISRIIDPPRFTRNATDNIPIVNEIYATFS